MNNRLRPSQRRPILASVLLLLVLPSCGDDAGRPMRYPATGKVLIDGKGEAGIQVRLHPVDRFHDVDALAPVGVTDAEGAYRLGTYEEADGAPLGRYKATLFWPDKPPGPGRPGDLFSGAYSKPESSAWDFNIAEGDNTLDEIQATKPATPRPTPRRRAAPGSGPDPDGPSTK